MNILVMIKDLVLSTQIRTACEAKSSNYISARSNQKFNEALEKTIPQKVIIDLNIDGADAFEAIIKAKEKLPPEQILCFYSHVNVELAEKAQSLGINPDNVYRRSKFFNDLSNIVS